MFGQQVTPNHHKLAQEFPLLDNLYVSGRLSADGHQWVTQAYVTDYLEKSFGNFVRSYPFNGGDSLAYSPAGFLWENAVRHSKSVRVYGEFANELRGLAITLTLVVLIGGAGWLSNMRSAGPGRQFEDARQDPSIAADQRHPAASEREGTGTAADPGRPAAGEPQDTRSVEEAWAAASDAMGFGDIDTVPDENNEQLLDRAIWYGTMGFDKPYPGDGRVLRPEEVVTSGKDEDETGEGEDN
jgi:hypothetical protein